MRKPLEARAGLGRAWAGLATARGGLRGGASPACGVLGARASYRSRFLAQTTREALGGSPRLKSGRSCSGAGSTSRSGGGGGVVVADWSQGCVFGLPSPADRCARSLRGSHGVSGHGAEPGEWDCGGGPAHLRRRPVQIQRLHGSGSRLRAWGSSWGTGEASAAARAGCGAAEQH